MTRGRRKRGDTLILWLAGGLLVLFAVIALGASLLACERPIVAIGGGGIHLRPAPASIPAGSLIIQPPVPYSPDSIDLRHRLRPPGRDHWLGTDDLGRDVLARMIHGSRVSLTVGFVATAIALLVGTLLGALAGYYSGVFDWIVSRLIEVILCFPFLVLLLAIVALFEPSLWTIIVALGLTSWTSEARFVRAEFLRNREMEFAAAARASGAGDARIIFRHLLPNSLSPVIVSATFGVGSAILIESAISFLGLGVPLPTASWGTILASAHEHVTIAWWLVVFPGAAIFVTVAACNLLGDALRDVLDPRGDR
ncbi:MAG TPA: ABC transporter permease [Thermoanaerobaculia bacterium]|nr:ABC transporter permease [Thermoanaerobaculia bacterium]